jgi:thiosulfate dehydrogenase (quinone) large subunit
MTLSQQTRTASMTASQLVTDWRADASVAYALLRLTLGVNIGLRGMVRIAHGPAAFAQGIVKQMEPTILPASLVYAFAASLVWVESAVGILLILGLQTRLALIVGGLMMTLLTFGTMQIENFQNAWLQLTYALVFFVVLVLRSWNHISIDALMGSNRAK